MRGQQEFINLYKVLDWLSIDSERAQKGHIFKIKCLRQIYSSKNFMSKGYKPLSIKLTGHKDKVTSISCLGDHILSGSRDKLVKLWNIKTKKWITYNDHMNWITKVLFIDNFAISGSADKYVKIRPLNNIMESQSSYKHNGHITGLYKIDDSKIISIWSNGQLIMFDLFLQRQMFVDETKDFVFDYFSHNEDLVCTYSSSQSKGVIRDLHTMKSKKINIMIYSFMYNWYFRWW